MLPEAVRNPFGASGAAISACLVYIIAQWCKQAACLPLQLKLSFYHQRDLQVRANDDRHWDFVVAPGGPQEAAAVAEYTQAVHAAAAAAASRGETGGGSGQQASAAGAAVPSSPRSPHSRHQTDPNAPVTGKCPAQDSKLCQDACISVMSSCMHCCSVAF